MAWVKKEQQRASAEARDATPEPREWHGTAAAVKKEASVPETRDPLSVLAQFPPVVQPAPAGPRKKRRAAAGSTRDPSPVKSARLLAAASQLTYPPPRPPTATLLLFSATAAKRGKRKKSPGPQPPATAPTRQFAFGQSVRRVDLKPPPHTASHRAWDFSLPLRCCCASLPCLLLLRGWFLVPRPRRASLLACTSRGLGGAVGGVRSSGRAFGGDGAFLWLLLLDKVHSCLVASLLQGHTNPASSFIGALVCTAGIKSLSN